MSAPERSCSDLVLDPIEAELHGAIDPTRDYVLELAVARDALELHRLFFAAPWGATRRRLLGEVRRLVDDAALWLARARVSGHIVGTCFVEVPRSETGEVDGPAEYGGAIILPAHRRRGLGLALTSVAIAHHFWEADPAPLLAHVYGDDPAPRAIVHRTGFRAVGRVPLPPETFGLEHLAQDREGSLHADAFVLEDHGRAGSFRRVAAYLEQGTVAGIDGRPSALYLEIHPEMTPEALRSAAASVDAGDDSINAA